MKKWLLIFAVSAAACAQAAWYWPFTSDEDNTNKPPRLHRLLEKANDFIELAEDETVKGDADKALDYYHQALDELARVQMENPDRAEKPEFAPLRNKIAACRAAVDTIRFEQVNSNIRAVSVTDTTELQRKWNKKHGIVDPDDEAAARKAAEKKEADAAKARAAAEKEAAEKKKDADSGSGGEKETKGGEEEPWGRRLAAAAELLRAGDHEAADARLQKLAEEHPGDLNLLLLHSAALAAGGRLYAARKKLEQARSLHPSSYLPCYNLAYVALELGEGRKAARSLYEQGRELGGPVNDDIESRLKED